MKICERLQGMQKDMRERDRHSISITRRHLYHPSSPDINYPAASRPRPPSDGNDIVHPDCDDRGRKGSNLAADGGAGGGGGEGNRGARKNHDEAISPSAIQ